MGGKHISSLGRRYEIIYGITPTREMRSAGITERQADLNCLKFLCTWPAERKMFAQLVAAEPAVVAAAAVAAVAPSSVAVVRLVDSSTRPVPSTAHPSGPPFGNLNTCG